MHGTPPGIDDPYTLICPRLSYQKAPQNLGYNSLATAKKFYFRTAALNLS
jgi:hypothetical protein